MTDCIGPSVFSGDMPDWMEMRSLDSGAEFDVQQLPAAACHVTSVHCQRHIRAQQQLQQQQQQQPAPACHHRCCLVLKKCNGRTDPALDADTPLNNARACHTKPFVGENRPSYTLYAIVYTRLPTARIYRSIYWPLYPAMHGHHLCIYCLYIRALQFCGCHSRPNIHVL